MALKIVWTRQAAKGYAQVILYLEVNWPNEIENFYKEVKLFFEHLKTYPELLQESSKKKNLRRGPINRHTMLTYRIKPRKNQIEIINFRATKQNPM